jgi:hypothetical protein
MANEPQNPQDPNDKSWKPAFDNIPDNPGQPAGNPPPGYDRVAEAGTFQMLWDCKYCSTKKLLGVTHKFCPSCGAAQDANARYFPSDEEAMPSKITNIRALTKSVATAAPRTRQKPNSVRSAARQ